MLPKSTVEHWNPRDFSTLPSENLWNVQCFADPCLEGAVREQLCRMVTAVTIPLTGRCWENPSDPLFSPKWALLLCFRNYIKTLHVCCPLITPNLTDVFQEWPKNLRPQPHFSTSGDVCKQRTISNMENNPSYYLSLWLLCNARSSEVWQPCLGVFRYENESGNL